MWVGCNKTGLQQMVTYKYPVKMTVCRLVYSLSESNYITGDSDARKAYWNSIATTLTQVSFNSYAGAWVFITGY